MTQILTTTLKEASKYSLDCLMKGIVPTLHSSPGIGKSATIKQIAKELKLKIIDVRLAQCDPTDLNGFPHIYEDAQGVKRATYIPMDIFPIEGTPIPAGYNGWLLFLDEITSAPPAVQSAAYKVVLDRQVGQYNLDSNCLIAAAGNLLSDNAVVERQSTALQSRMAHYVIECNKGEFLDWAAKSGIDDKVIAFINFQPDALYNFDPNHTDMTFACPRTWEFCSWKTNGRNITGADVVDIAGVIGQGAAVDFTTFCEVYGKIPSFADIVANPHYFKFDEDSGSVKWALATMIAANIETTNAKECMIALTRLGGDFGMVAMRMAFQKNGPSLMACPDVAVFVSRFGTEYFME